MSLVEVADQDVSGHDRTFGYRPGVGHPQHLLLTLLGDYWIDENAVAPSSALVDLLAEFDVSATAARAALNRLTRRGLLQSTKSGRSTYYELTDHARRLLNNGLRRIASFGMQPPTWDGTWTFVAFSVPEDQRNIRHQLRTKLRWLGFAPLYDGLWVSARQSADDVRGILTEMNVSAATVIVGSETAAGSFYGRPIDAWDLDRVRALYDDFIVRMQPVQARLRAIEESPVEALRARTRAMDEWRTMPNDDPELPIGLLPPEWPRAAARRIFCDIYDQLAESATVRVREVVGTRSPKFVPLVAAHTVSS